jgi:putative glycosyltransferase (TIGR04372 family)
MAINNYHRFIRLTRLAVSTPIAVIVVLVIRIIRPILLVRIGVMRSDRIGHFALETELWLLEQESGVTARPKRSIDVWYAPEPIANRVLYKMWTQVLTIWPNWLMVTVFRLNQLIPGTSAHEIKNATSSCLDVHNLLDIYPPRLKFTAMQLEQGQKGLAELGIKPTDRFVCFIVRDSAYTKKVFPEKDMSYHDFRNCDVDDYVAGAEALADRGLFVLRMGSVVSKPLVSTNPRVIDYANSKVRSEFMDLFLGAHCEFNVSDGLGFYAIPAMFRRPNAYVNYSPFFMFYSSRACDLGIAKTMIDTATSKRLNLTEMGERGVARSRSSAEFVKAGVSVKSNTPSEIKDLMLEMLDRLEGKWKTQPLDEELQNKFWKKYSEIIGPDRETFHGEIWSKYGAQFLRDNQDWIV